MIRYVKEVYNLYMHAGNNNLNHYKIITTEFE